MGLAFQYFVDGVSVLNFADPNTKTLGNVILNAYNYGADYDVYWDNFLTKSDNPAAYLPRSPA